MDGPETITDQQRGKGYFQKTYHGIQLARKYGIEVGVICTFTPISARDMETVIDFFIQEGLPISIHVTTPVIGHNQSEWIFTPQGAGATYVKLFDLYLDKINKIEVRNFDALARGIACNRGSTCTFINCLGKHLSIGPEGEIFLCNRFAGHPHLQLGNILVHKKLSDLKSTSTWKKFAAREGNVAKDCGDCTHYDYCAGGCAFNTLSNSNGLRDPGCQAYKSIFDHIINCAAQEAIAPKNISALINTEKPEGLLRHGKLIDIMVGRSHRS